MKRQKRIAKPVELRIIAKTFGPAGAGTIEAKASVGWVREALPIIL